MTAASWDSDPRTVRKIEDCICLSCLTADQWSRETSAVPWAHGISMLEICGKERILCSRG